MRECENWEMWKCGNYRREMRHGIAKYGNCIRSLSEVEGSHFPISQFSHFFIRFPNFVVKGIGHRFAPELGPISDHSFKELIHGSIPHL